jgi:hypothetical protein
VVDANLRDSATHHVVGTSGQRWHDFPTSRGSGNDFELRIEVPFDRRND